MRNQKYGNKYNTVRRALTSALIILTTCSITFAANQQELTSSGKNGQIRWQLSPSWSVKEQSLDMAHSLDGKRIFSLTNKQEVQIFSSEGSLLGAIPVASGVSHIDISPMGDKLYLLDSDKKTFTEVTLAFKQAIDTTNAPTQGPENAPISIVLFTDFQCPYCKKLPPVLEEVRKKNPQTVKVFFKNMPLISIHDMAEGAARAAIAAGNQGKFWPYHDKLFAAEKLSTKKLKDFAKELGLDVDKFNADMHSPETTKALQKDLYDAQKAGVEGTPSIFINGWPLGKRTVEGFQAMINALLEEKG